MDRILKRLFQLIPGEPADRVAAGWSDRFMGYTDERLWTKSLAYRVGWRESKRLYSTERSN